MHSRYIIAGGIVACVLYTLTEMVTCRPLTGTLVDLPHKFLDPAAGFAVGASYTLSNTCSMSILNAQSAELTALLKDKPQRHNIEAGIGIKVFFIALTTISHYFGVKFYGGLERVHIIPSTVIVWFKLNLFVLVCVLMLVINVGDYTSHAFTPGWKPTGFDSAITPVLRSTGVDDAHFGIAGSGGRFFAFLTAATSAMFSCKGGEIVAMTAGNAKHPWKDVPLAMSFVYIVPLSLYPLILLSAGANVNYADPNLPRLWARGKGGMALPPFVIAAQSSALRGLPKALNPFFIISAYTAANTALYAASSCQFFGRTNNGHTPLAAILLYSALGFLSLAGLSKYTYRLKILEKSGLVERDSDLYITRLFKSRWQPLPAYIGIVGRVFVILWSGIPPRYIIITRGHLTSSNNLKSKVAFMFDVIGYYIGPVLFATFYLVYKYPTPRSFRVDLRDLTPSHYVLGHLDSLEQENPNTAPRKPSNANEPQSLTSTVELESPGRAGLSSANHRRGGREGDPSPETIDEAEAQRARRE
ncbi:hypothetical protein K469DRAFT_739270 [Zopfia rhizophila CBS 207.26]|uniref:Amino acid permease/ SLC12A domain-containing protein n=1 Tax=Zopfia rhizophila CBS 207.26 TaxID=1314779 RepID=A0A6A6E0T7_9PEZI|nr:hypothetical protein K469DRAFT_739270 [Zopfia rhizophila CBS 207.26]